MKTVTKSKKRHSPEQIVRRIQQADRIFAEGRGAALVLRKLSLTEASAYLWPNHHGGLKAEDAKTLK